MKEVMSLEPSYVPKDIADYEEKIMFGLSLRQLGYGALAIGSGSGFYVLTFVVLKIPQDFCLICTVAIAFGLFALGWAKWQGTRPFSDFLKAFFTFRKLKQTVVYSNELYYYSNKGKGDENVWKKTREDERINKQQCSEHRK